MQTECRRLLPAGRRPEEDGGYDTADEEAPGIAHSFDYDGVGETSTATNADQAGVKKVRAERGVEAALKVAAAKASKIGASSASARSSRAVRLE
ncbi:MAG: hypothetical protein ACHQ0I_03320 [Candidatus Lutacidiplasmatales archaeon]